MKFSFTSTVATALAIATIGASSAADINVVGAKDTPMMMRTSDAAAAARTGIDVKIATADILNKPTALINKNTLAMDNNVFVSRSNIVFSQNDRLKMMKKVEAMVTSAADSDMSTAVLSKNILKAVSGKDTDTAIMTKASAVVTAKDDADARGQRIADLVNAVFDMKTKESEEQSIQSEVPRGVTILIGTKDILRQPTGVVNKNIAVSDNQIAISGSMLSPTQNDVVTLGGNAKVADAVAPGSVIKVAKAETEKDEMDNYRVGFLYNKEGASTADKKKDEYFGMWGGGLGFGWRYPLGYWNMYGAGLYGGGCGLGMPYGGYFYC